MDLAESVIIVTGASSGIGEATARAAHQRGMRVVVAARRDQQLVALADELPGVHAVTADVTDPGGRERIVEQTVQRFGRVDVLVNNAGQGLHVPLEEIELDAYREVLELNLVAPLALMQLVLPLMRGAGRGAVVNISSGTTRRVIPGLGGYASTKAALNTLSQTARAEWEQFGIAVSLVIPGMVATGFHHVMRQGSWGAGRPTAGAPPQAVAAAVLRAVETGDAEVFPSAV